MFMILLVFRMLVHVTCILNIFTYKSYFGYYGILDVCNIILKGIDLLIWFD